MTIQTFKNWRCEIDEQKIFWLSIDRADKSMNSIDSSTVEELNAVIDLIHEQRNSIIGVALKSGKKRGFIAGADIEEFTKIDLEHGGDLIKASQDVLNRFEALPVPTIALIDGVALGGGLEFALACTYRVAVDTPDVKIGLPEVNLGIHPGWGGTVRLPRLIGALKALPLILTGKQLDARKAKKLGIVDDVVRNKFLLLRAAVNFLTQRPTPHQASFIDRMSNHKLIRPLLANRMRKQTQAKISREHYPAPFYVIDNWQAHGVDFTPALQAEVDSFAKCFLHPTSTQLIRAFFLRTKLSGLGRSKEFVPQSVHVVGAGTMGGDIAAYCALMGLRVTVQDREMKYIAPAIARAHALFSKKCENSRDVTLAMDRLIPDPKGEGVAKADVVIEAIYENLEAKHTLYKEIEPKLKKGALLATNTSSIPLEILSSALKQPERLIGIHFFNPVAQMMLVEVVRGKNSSESEVKKGMGFVGRIGKLPLSVTSSPGFLINRILMPYMMEAVALLEEGVPPAAIDKAAVDFGMPMGPLELSDVVGLDVGLSVAQTLSQYFEGQVPKKLLDLVANGNLGKKSGSGVYTWREGKPVKVTEYQPSEVPNDIIDRLMLRMVNEAAACIEEGVIDDSDLLDGGMIFGTGFAPFRGGPIQYAKDRGLKDVIKTLKSLAKKHGKRFNPHPGLGNVLKDQIEQGALDAEV